MPAIPEHRALPATMRALRLHAPGGVEALAFDVIPVPHPGPGEVLVRVHAAAITRDELTWSTDRLPAVPSFELAGTVAALGAGVSGVSVGDDVFALTPFDRQGVAADFAAVPTGAIAPKPARLTPVEAAALPMAALTAFQALFDHGRLQRGERVMVTGAAGGVGHVAVQLAHQHGAHVTAVASAGRHDLLRSLGADIVVDRNTALRPGGTAPVDLVFDTTGGALLAAAPRLIAPGGRIVTVAESPPAGVVATYFVVTPDGARLKALTPRFDDGTVRAVVAATFPIDRAGAAFTALTTRGKTGKVVLEVSDESA